MHVREDGKRSLHSACTYCGREGERRRRLLTYILERKAPFCAKLSSASALSSRSRHGMLRNTDSRNHHHPRHQQVVMCSPLPTLPCIHSISQPHPQNSPPRPPTIVLRGVRAKPPLSVGGRQSLLLGGSVGEPAPYPRSARTPAIAPERFRGLPPNRTPASYIWGLFLLRKRDWAAGRGVGREWDRAVTGRPRALLRGNHWAAKVRSFWVSSLLCEWRRDYALNRCPRCRVACVRGKVRMEKLCVLGI